jgi:hypothetical protein
MRRVQLALRAFKEGARFLHRPHALESSGTRRRGAVAAAVLLLLAGAGGAPRAAAQNPDWATYGRWSDIPFDWGFAGASPDYEDNRHVGVHLSVLPNGRVLSFPPYRHADVQVWEPEVDGFTIVRMERFGDIFCSGHAFLPDGRLFAAGGHLNDGEGDWFTNLFDWTNLSSPWTNGPDMGNEEPESKRWYPTCVTLPSGDVLIAAGTWRGDIYNPGNPGNPVSVNDRIQIYRWTSGALDTLSNTQSFAAWYPYMHVAPNGQVFISGPHPQSQYLDTGGGGSLSNVDDTVSPDNRYFGSSVMYQPGRVLITGGTPTWYYGQGWPLQSAERIDLTVPNPTWQTAGNMEFPRKHHNMTILPDGQVLVTGGTRSFSLYEAGWAANAAEIWNPDNGGSWSTLASMRLDRMYHSAAVLLPDARVLVTGGWWGTDVEDVDRPAGQEDGHENAEIFYPPYLFNADDGTDANRPRTEDAPGSIGYNNTNLVIQTGAGEADSIERVTLVGLSSVTHSFNMGQRFMDLTNIRRNQMNNTVTVNSPANANVCPPGYYMLFILRPNPRNGGQLVPSVARMIRIGL